MSDTAPRRAPPRSAKTAQPAPPCTMVIFGANGDLTKRLLMPALYNLSGSKLLDDKFASSASTGTPAAMRISRAGSKRRWRASRRTAGRVRREEPQRGVVGLAGARLHYMAGDFTQPETFKALADKLGDGNAIFYLAVADRFFGAIIDSCTRPS